MPRVMNRKKLELPLIDQERVTSFIKKWENTQGQGAELSDFQSFARDLCDALNLPHPDPKSDANKDNSYIFERPVDSFDADGQLKQGKNRIDLYKRDCFVMEGKQTGKKIGTHGWNTAMKKAYHQAENYVRTLPSEEGRPPFIVVIDVGRSIQLYSEFSCTGGLYQHYPDTGNFTIKLAEISKPDIQERLQTLWLKPSALDESKYAAEVTREVSATLAELAKSLEQAGFEVGRTAHFIKRCLFTMFSEDVDLIPEGSFTKLLGDLKQTPEHFVDSMTSLWNTMNTGGFEGQLRTKLRRFNGGLFTGIDPIPLTASQIQLLMDAAKADWRYVEPAIFGTLLERALDPRERHKLGAHYTPRAYVERLVMPTLIEPLREKWNTVQVEVEILLQADSKNSEDKARSTLSDFHQHLCNIKILDPACGSANFLYVALEHLKRLEGEVLNAIRDLSGGQSSLEAEGFTVDPHQFLGIEINPRAAAIAEIVLWIGYLQWHYRIHGKLDLPEPILRDFKNIENRDALIDYDSKEELLDMNGVPVTIWDGVSYKTSAATSELIPDENQRIAVYRYINSRKAEWPDADYIIGNPPFIGNKRMRNALGDGYVTALRAAWSELPESIDFVMYWWNIAANKIVLKQDKSFGFITTNSLSQEFNRRIISEKISKDECGLLFVIPDHPWVDASDGADVRISMTVFGSSVNKGKLVTIIDEVNSSDSEFKLNFKTEFGKIHSDLKIGADTSSAQDLKSNSTLSNRGMIPNGSGFLVGKSDAKYLDNGKLLKKYSNNKDLTGISRDIFVIDTFGLTETNLKADYPESYQWLLERVKPTRIHNKRKSVRENWWLFGEPRKVFRKANAGLLKYIVTGQTGKHRIFQFIDGDTTPDDKLIAISSDSSAVLGILNSRLHSCWSLRTGGRMGVGNDPVYVKSSCFERFPFPSANADQKKSIGALADKIDSHRKQQQAIHSKLTLTNIYNVLEKLRKDKPLDTKEQLINQQGLVSTLRELHDDLDQEVFTAYGWQDLGGKLVGNPGSTTPLPNKSDEQAQAEEELLSRLVDLNLQRTKEEKDGKVRWLRPDYQNPEATEQPNLELVESSSTVEKVAVAKVLKLTWPKPLSEQVSAVVEVLENTSTLEEVAESFKRKPLKQVLSVLEALEALGRAQLLGDKWELT
jgi:hypothetical protein